MLGAEIFFGEDLPLKEKGYFQAGQVTIKPERKLDLHADGGYTGQASAQIGLIQPRQQ